MTDSSSAGDSAPGSAMRRKIAAAAAPAARGIGPDRALAQAFARAAQEGLGLILQVTRVDTGRAQVEDLAQMAGEQALIFALDGPAGGTGIAALSPGLMAGLIEMRMMGRLTPHSPAPRPPTPTDAAICGDTAQGTLDALATALAGTADESWTAGFRLRGPVAAEALALLLEAGELRCLRAHAEFGSGGARSGILLLALPAAGRAPVSAPAPEAAPAPDPGFAAALAAQVMAADARIDAVLARLALPLARLLALAPGATLALPGAALAALRLEGPGGVAVAGAELGQAEGRRAIRLTGASPGVERPGASPGLHFAAAEEGAGWPEPGVPARMAG